MINFHFVIQKMTRRQNADDPEQISANGNLRFETIVMTLVKITMAIMIISIKDCYSIFLYFISNQDEH